MRAGKHDLRSVASLYAAIDDAAASRRLRLRVLRGAEEHQVTLRLGEATLLDGAPAATAGRTARGEHRV